MSHVIQITSLSFLGAGDWLPFTQTLNQGWPATNTIFTTSSFIQLIPRCQPFFTSCPWSIWNSNRPSSGGSLQPAPRLMGDSAKGTGYAQALPRLHGSKLTWPISGDHQVVRPRQTTKMHRGPSTEPLHCRFQHPVGGNSKHCLRSSSPLATVATGRRFWGRCRLLLWWLILDIATRHLLGPRQFGGRYPLDGLKLRQLASWK